MANLLRHDEHASPPSRGREGASSSENLDAQRISGLVKWFDSAKGYGFVKPFEGGADILMHQSCVRHSGFKTIREGATVVCDAGLISRVPEFRT